MEPDEAGPERRDEASSVEPFRPSGELPAALRSILDKVSPAPEFAATFNLIVRSAGAMEQAAKRLQNWKAAALEFIDGLQSDLIKEKEGGERLKESLICKDGEIDALAAQLREAESKSAAALREANDLRRRVGELENELNAVKKWFSYFEQDVAPVFNNSARLLEDIGEISVGDEQRELMKRAK